MLSQAPFFRLWTPVEWSRETTDLCECQALTDLCEGTCQTGEYCDQGECVFGDSCGSDDDCSTGFCCNLPGSSCVPEDYEDPSVYCAST